AELHGQSLPASTVEALAPHAQVLHPMSSLQEVLDAFDLFQNAFRSLEAVERLTFEAVEDAALDGVRLLELRFSPGFMAQPAALDWDGMMEAILRGVARARERYDIVVGLIAIVSRSLGPSSARDTVGFALRWRGELVGFDLADAEDMFPAEAFASELAPLHEAGIPLTIHSGENVGPDHIRASVDLLGARRIGHGVSIVRDESLVQRCIREGWALEMCPTSNVRTCAVPSFEEHPAAGLLARGAPVTLNSDDPGLFAITLSGELEVARARLGFTDDMIRQATRNALTASFVDSDTRSELLERTPEWRQASIS
ncbi:MAG: adenosine deaminase, partial [Myxococcota bacterium]|nr:adenosine deaminase [Myxococcota bacterium]